MPSETIGKTIAVAAGVCVVCSVFVSTAAVYLRPYQVRNKALDKKKNILVAAGLLEKGEPADLDELFDRNIQIKWVDLRTGKYVPENKENQVAAGYADERKAARNPQLTEEIKDDIAGIKRRADYQKVYLTKKDGRIDRLILPVYGKGLWSTLYGFLALGPDLNTIESFGFFEHEETPGLGGEVDNPRWKTSWNGKEAFDKNWEPAVKVVKGRAEKGKIHEVDGLSGATLTARGVDNLVRFWLGDEGFGPFLEKLREGEGGGNG